MDKRDAQRIAESLIEDHLMGEGWSFEWTHTHNRNRGMCRYREKLISFNAAFINIAEEDEFRQTILHEIAHALAGPESRAHGIEWKRIARSIGVRNPRATANFSASRYEVAKSVRAKWLMVHGLDIVKHYVRRPRRDTFMNLERYFLKGRPETEGELELLTMEQYEDRMACDES